jgi:hypothetical protein
MWLTWAPELILYWLIQKAFTDECPVYRCGICSQWFEGTGAYINLHSEEEGPNGSSCQMATPWKQQLQLGARLHCNPAIDILYGAALPDESVR